MTHSVTEEHMRRERIAADLDAWFRRRDAERAEDEHRAALTEAALLDHPPAP